MDKTQGIVTAMAIALGLVLVYGIYRLIMRRFSASKTLQSGTATENGRQAVKAVFTIIVTILIFLAVYFAYDYFVHREV